MKISELNKYLLHVSRINALTVLNEIKRHPLTGHNLEDMKTLETAVQHLEIFQMNIK